MDLESSLPPVVELSLQPWEKSYGADFYGALKVAAEYCGLKTQPDRWPGAWQHGCMPPWQQVKPEIIVYNAPRSVNCIVARKDEVEYLKRGGYAQVRAIGLPMIYTKASCNRRIPNSLLVMPTHSQPWEKGSVSVFEAYVRQLLNFRDHFDVVMACLSPLCIANGYWVPQCHDAGIPIISGALYRDANALRRMRAILDTFEFVTTNGYGSHVPYALYCGCKVSLWGPETQPTREEMLKDQTWVVHPDALDRFLSAETQVKAEAVLRRFRVPPRSGILDPEFGAWMLGAENKLNREELLEEFGWTTWQLMKSRVAANVRKHRSVRVLSKILRSIAK